MNHEFKFDHVFREHAPQKEVFDKVAVSVIQGKWILPPYLKSRLKYLKDRTKLNYMVRSVLLIFRLSNKPVYLYLKHCPFLLERY